MNWFNYTGDIVLTSSNFARPPLDCSNWIFTWNSIRSVSHSKLFAARVNSWWSFFLPRCPNPSEPICACASVTSRMRIEKIRKCEKLSHQEDLDAGVSSFLIDRIILVLAREKEQNESKRKRSIPFFLFAPKFCISNKIVRTARWSSTNPIFKWKWPDKWSQYIGNLVGKVRRSQTLMFD